MMFGYFRTQNIGKLGELAKLHKSKEISVEIVSTRSSDYDPSVNYMLVVKANRPLRSTLIYEERLYSGKAETNFWDAWKKPDENAKNAALRKLKPLEMLAHPVPVRFRNADGFPVNISTGEIISETDKDSAK